MNKILCNTGNGCVYAYSKNYKEFVYLPKDFEIAIDSSTLKESSDDYYARKSKFLEEKGFFDTVKHDFTDTYPSQSILYNLANLRSFVIEVTDGCNMACKYCGYRDLYDNYDERHNKKLSFNLVKSFIDYLKDLWNSPYNISYNNTITVSFYGGEPLTNMKLIRETIDYLESLNLPTITFRYNMTTNAYLLKECMDYLVEKDFSLLISLDGNRKNNSYRVLKNDKETFDVVVKNVKLLQETYPEFFESNVRFNSVLHNRNSSEEAIDYIQTTFGKVPNVALLNTNGVAKEKEEEFKKMFMTEVFVERDYSSCEDIDSDMLLADSKITLYNSFLSAFLSDTYTAYPDLFEEDNLPYVPTGTCQPFSRKIFLTVNGKILPCERVGQLFSLGTVTEEKVDIDFEYVSNFYANKYKKIIKRCSQCVLWKNCGLCVFYLKKKENGEEYCDRFLPYTKASAYVGEMLSFFENTPWIYKRILEDLSVY